MSENRNYIMKTSVLPISDEIILRISALLLSLIQDGPKSYGLLSLFEVEFLQIQKGQISIINPKYIKTGTH